MYDRHYHDRLVNYLPTILKRAEPDIKLLLPGHAHDTSYPAAPTVPGLNSSNHTGASEHHQHNNKNSKPSSLDEGNQSITQQSKSQSQQQKNVSSSSGASGNTDQPGSQTNGNDGKNNKKNKNKVAQNLTIELNRAGQGVGSENREGKNKGGGSSRRVVGGANVATGHGHVSGYQPGSRQNTQGILSHHQTISGAPLRKVPAVAASASGSQTEMNANEGVKIHINGSSLLGAMLRNEFQDHTVTPETVTLQTSE